MLDHKDIDAILDKAISFQDITKAEALCLLNQKSSPAIAKIKQTADYLRQKQSGETVSYIINRNINFTNICEQHCSFCAFRRDANTEGAFWLKTEHILEKTAEAVELGATEICMQGGLHPEAKIAGTSLNYYRNLIQTIKQNYPKIHFHGFSPQEIQFIAREDQISYTKVISSLLEVGLGSMPGTAAEILDDKIRKIICPEKINTDTWLEIVSTAHQLGVPTTSTMLAGHIETPDQQIDHLEKLRLLQQRSIQNNYAARITEFIILPFIGETAPKPIRRRVKRDQPIVADILLLTAVSRIFLGNTISNHQPSWVKLGLTAAKEALNWGCNDLGGTLMEEHITTMAGAKGGTGLSVEAIKVAISSLQRPYRQRTTLYANAT